MLISSDIFKDFVLKAKEKAIEAKDLQSCISRSNVLKL